MSQPVVVRIDHTPAQCDTCLYWKLNQHISACLVDMPTVGYCRRNAPCSVTDPDHAPNAVWPMTESTDACGEFRRMIQSTLTTKTKS